METGMCRIATEGLSLWARSVAWGLLASILSIVPAQPQDLGSVLEWRRIGTTVFDLGLPAYATGPVSRVWYSASGDRLYARLPNGQTWETQDFENWRLAIEAAPPPVVSAASESSPEEGARIQQAARMAARFYALGRFVHRSDDGGKSWANVTAHRGRSILGEGLSDLAISPADPDEIAVAGRYGIWRSLDGGVSWDGVNQGLPNLPARRILSLPNGLQPARLFVPLGPASGFEAEWAPGERNAWRAAAAAESAEALRERLLSERLGLLVRAAESSGEYVYAGSADGRIFVSSDAGKSWGAGFAVGEGSSVERFWVNPLNPQQALAALSRPPERTGPRLLRTVDGGRYWDDLSQGLPEGDAYGVSAHPPTGSIYLATSEGLYWARTDLANLVPTDSWRKLSGNLPSGRVLDVRLDEAGNQLYALLEGRGLYAAMAPHRVEELAVVHAADLSSRPAAPGALLSILGARLERVSAGNLRAPVLGGTKLETQIQVPFEAAGERLTLVFEFGGSQRTFGLALYPSAPAVFIDREGSPLLLDADSGAILDAANPARSGSRIQILATGLGAVDPPWPTGVAAPMDNPPRVVAPVRVYMDRQPIEVTRATLAPGFVGFYLVEVQLPKLVNLGPAELYLEAGGRQSNRVRLYLEP